VPACSHGDPLNLLPRHLVLFELLRCGKGARPEEAQQQQAGKAAASVECDKGAALLPNRQAWRSHSLLGSRWDKHHLGLLITGIKKDQTRAVPQLRGSQEATAEHC
jgi:hypothetical protein